MLVRMKSGSLGPKGDAGTYEIWHTAEKSFELSTQRQNFISLA